MEIECNQIKTLFELINGNTYTIGEIGSIFDIPQKSVESNLH